MERNKYIPDKIVVYAAALDTDIGAVSRVLVVDGKAKQLFGGTVFGGLVKTELGSTFDTFDRARENALLFVQQCEAVLNHRRQQKTLNSPSSD